MEKTIMIKDVVLQYLSTKENEYHDNICYFKFNRGHKKELVRLSKMEKCKLPFWTNDKKLKKQDIIKIYSTDELDKLM